jgi:alkylated DNA repair protein alkB family protein 8
LENSDRWVGVSASNKSRRVIHYGYNYSYIKGPLTITDPIPNTYHVIINKIKEYICQFISAKSSDLFDQLIINEYLPGQGISAHIDDTNKFGSIIACITLNSGVQIDFLKSGNQPQKIYVGANSLYIMSGDARYLWKHSIASRQSDIIDDERHYRKKRISLTFRTTFI